MTTIKSFSFPSSCDGLRIAGICAVPDREFCGIMQFVHGMAEHKERYEEVMRFFADAGYLCILHDHRGHGESIRNQEDLGYFYGKHANYLLEDIHELSLLIKQEYPELPLILFGHSMGSLLVRAYVKRYDEDIDALIVCGSPSRNPAAGLGKTLVKAMEKVKGERYRSPLIQKMAFGKNNAKFKEVKSENTWLCSDHAVVQAYDEDPLCGFTFTLNGFENLFSLMQDVYHAKNWQLHHPDLAIRFIAGKEDPCIINETAFQEAVNFMKERGYPNVTAKLYAGMRHEILNEPGKQQVYNDLLTWIQTQVR